MRTGTARPAAVTAVVLVAALALVVGWPVPARTLGAARPFALDRASAPPGPVVITSVGTSLLWRQGAQPSALIGLHNSSRHPTGCEAWWILDRPGAKRPWTDPVAVSARVRLELAPSESKNVPLEALALTADAGFYGLSIWVHCLNSGGRWLHSDGATMNGNVEVIKSDRDLRRIGPHSARVWIASLSAPTKVVSTRGAVIWIRVANGFPEPVVADAYVLLTPSKGRPPRGPLAAARSDVVQVNLPGAECTAVRLAVPDHLAGGVYGFTAFLSESTPAGEVRVDAVEVGRRMQVGG